MAKAEIESGICGFSATVLARMEGSNCLLAIDSDCDAIQRMAEELTEVDPFQEITFRGQDFTESESIAQVYGQSGPPVPPARSPVDGAAGWPHDPESGPALHTGVPQAAAMRAA